ncbi:MAG: cell surface protein SprA [Calditrichaeota bacterium]|nr:cell surface protein SprA [Calditrichota bacterium]MCB9365768.1 cell surface protein SprA [Calditrichota bacterium]
MKTPKGVLFLFLACFIACGGSVRAEVGFSFSLKNGAAQHRLHERPKLGIAFYGEQPLLQITAANLQETTEFDSLFTRVILRRHVGETQVAPPLVMDYDDYRDLRMMWDVRKALADAAKQGFKQQAANRAGEGIAIDVPFRIKSETFRRIFGGDNIGLRVQGNITIDGKIRQQKFDELQTANQKNTNTNFNIDMTQRFTIKGKIGEKVEVDVNQDSERLFDFENSLKLTYTGNRDEIVQKIEAGNVNLSLGTRLATFSGQNKGLFGLKTEAKVGALKLTGIASLERGQKNRQEPNKDARRATWTENEFLLNTYFWLTEHETFFVEPAAQGSDTLHVAGFRDEYRRISFREHLISSTPISEIEVWVSTSASGSQQDVNVNNGYATSLQKIEKLYDPASWDLAQLDEVDQTFRKLQQETDYTWEPNFGYIRLRRPLQGDDVLACSFVTTAGDTFGRIGAPSGELRLIMLRTENPSPDTLVDPTWNLMFRHVYSMQAQNINSEAFELEIIRSTGSSVPEDGPDNVQTYLEFFQFDTEGPNGAPGPDKYLDNYGAIVNWTFGELHFLDLTPFSPSGYIDVNTGETVYFPLVQLDSAKKAAHDSTDVLDSTLYTLPYSQVSTHGSAWKFQTKSIGSTSQYDLGPLVLEGSEEVTLNGVPLVRGTDYTIDYLSGQLKILMEAAKAPNANLVITYESGQVFQLDRKTLLGARAEYELWENSYIGGMVLKLDEKSLDKRVRIGNEPISNTLYDVNTQMKFKPNFLTAVADRLPLVKTNVASEFSIDGEIAKVFPNPNSLSNDATGDPNGVAFLDDFEASRRSTPLGLLRRNWTISSIPVIAGASGGDTRIDSLRGRLKWWNPIGDYQVKVKDVYPEREVNSQVADRLQSLVLEFTPDSSTGDPTESWGGVMRYLGAGYEDQSRAQFLEFWIDVPSAQEGRLVVDIGAISEDALPNDSMNSEDKPLPDEIVTSAKREYGNGVLNPGEEDTGIDGVFGDNELAPWNGWSRPLVPSNDNWSYSVGSNVYEQINGTENNRNDEGGNFPDSEDLNGNQNLDQANDYYSYDIELRLDSPYIVGGQNNDNNWRLFRIPIDDETVRRDVNNASLTNVRWARMYVTGVTRMTRIEIVQNDIVSNEWLPEYVDVDSTEWVSTAVINNHENPDYTSPPGVQGEEDPITGLRQREQSLVLKIEELDGDIDSSGAPDVFFVSKNLYQQINMIEYKRLKMFIHGGGVDEGLFRDEQYQLILRLGTSYTNTNTNYYEISKTIYKGWDNRNHIDVAMNDLSILRKLREDDGRLTGDTTLQDNLRRFAVVLDSLLFPGDSLIIAGTPSLQNVGFIALGVRAGKEPINRGDEIWVDELRVSDIYKDPGTAGEISTSLRIADLVTFAGSYTKQDADFHNVNERTGRQNSSETVLGSMNLNAAKFGLDQYGFTLPMVVTRSESESVPKYIPNTDVRVNQDNPDPEVIRKETRTTYSASYSKTGNSPNPLVRWSLERLRLSWDHSKVESRDYTYSKQKQSQTGVRADYGFPTASGRGLAPLFFLRNVPLLSLIGNPKVYYKPKQLTGTMSAQRSLAESLTREGRAVNSPNFVVTGSGSIGFDITDALSTGLSQSYGWTQVTTDTTFKSNGDLDTVIAVAKSWKDLPGLKRSDLTAEGWNWTNTYSPKLSRWLAPTFSYNSTYNWTNGSRQNAQNQTISNNNVIGSDLTLDFKQIFGGGRDSGRRDKPKPQPKPAKSTEILGDSLGVTPDSSVQEMPRGPAFSPLSLVGKGLKPFKTALLTLDPVQLNFDRTNRHSQGGVLEQAPLAYRLGFDSSPDVRTSAIVQSAPTTGKTDDFGARSGIRISRDIRTSFTYNVRDSENRATTQRTGSYEQSAFWLSPKDSASTATVVPFPDVSVDWSGFERISFLSKATRSVTLTSALSSRAKDDWQNERSNVITRTYTRQWSPLLGVNVSWLNEIDTQVRLNAANTLTKAENQRSAQRSATRGANATVSYTMRTGFRLPILWFGSMRLQNQTTLALNVDYQTTKQERSNTGAKFSTQQEQVQWSVQPRLTYSFSNTVNGGAQLQFQQTKDKVTDRGSRLFEFGINVSIAIRG